MTPTIIRRYEFLLEDPKADRDYTEGNITNGGYQVYGSALEMKTRFSNAFDKRTIASATHLLGVTPIWQVEDCTVIYETEPDKEISGRPHCFGNLTVVGKKPSVEKVNAILTRTFPGIDKLIRDAEY